MYVIYVHMYVIYIGIYVHIYMHICIRMRKQQMYVWEKNARLILLYVMKYLFYVEACKVHGLVYCRYVLALATI
jgi:hypothetical protein